MSNSNLIKLQHFFDVNTKIKKEMYNNVPPDDNGYLDEKSLCEYTDRLEETLRYIFSELKCIALDIFGEKSAFLNRIEKLEMLTKNDFYSCGFDVVKLRNFYEKHISNMDVSFVEKVKETCVGYTLDNYLPINMVNSINEMLHLIHSYVLNNEYILQSVPVVAQKQNIYDYTITLRGVSTNLFQQLFE